MGKKRRRGISGITSQNKDVVSNLSAIEINEQPLDDRDLMELIILPLTYKGKENQRRVAREAINLAIEIESEIWRCKYYGCYEIGSHT